MLKLLLKYITEKRSLNNSLFWISFGSILYTYFGYPLFLTLLAKRKPERDYQIDFLPKVTLLIAAYNEELVIEEKINNCLELDYPKENLQILIVTDGSDDRTPEIVEDYVKQQVELLHTPMRRGKMAAINRAIPYASGDIIVFSDANNHYKKDTLKYLVAPFQDAKVGATSGEKAIKQDGSNLGASEGIYWKYESYIKKQETRLSSCTGVAGEIFAIRRYIYSPPPDHIINDDFYMAMQVLRQGYRIVYVPQAKSIEKISISPKHEIIRRKRIIAGRYQAIGFANKILPLNNPLLVWQIISHKFMRPLVPFSMIIAAITNLNAFLKNIRLKEKQKKFWSLNSRLGNLLLTAQALFYGSAFINSKVRKPDKSNTFFRILYLPKFLIDSNVAALLGFIEYIKGQQTNLWERIPRQ